MSNHVNNPNTRRRYPNFISYYFSFFIVYIMFISSTFYRWNSVILQYLSMTFYRRCDPTFLESVDPTLLLAGGNTKLRGFPERLQHEMDKGGFERTVIAHDNRDITTWIGGAILASHSSFGERWISSEDFDEFGTSLVHKQAIWVRPGLCMGSGRSRQAKLEERG